MWHANLPHSSSSFFQKLQTRLHARHPMVKTVTPHQSSLNHLLLSSCLHHLLVLVPSSISLLESSYFLAFFYSGYDYSNAIGTTLFMLSLLLLFIIWTVV